MRPGMKVLAVLLLFVLAVTPDFAAAPAAGGTPAAARPTIAIQPLGKVSPDVLAEARMALGRLYEAEVITLPGKPLPASAFYEPRGRYRADKLLDWLQAETDGTLKKVVGITESDVSTTKGEIPDWGVFGLGSLGQRSCVVSTFRLGRNVPRSKMLERLGRVVGHEIGHTFGLDHCKSPGCLMADAEGKVATVDSESGELCEACRQRVPAKR
jgi:archaemetzincin